MRTRSKRATRVVEVATAAALVLGVSACAGSSDDSAGAKSAGSFTYWSMWQSSEPQARVLKAAIARFTAQTGIKVNVDWVGRGISTKIGPSIAANQAPDLWDGADSTVYGTEASAGQALDLSPVLKMKVPGEDATVGSVIPAKYFAMEPKDPAGSDTYLIPYEVASTGMFYNAADPVIKAAMPTVPTTWAGLLSVCAELKAKGMACIASEGADSWTNELYFDYLLNAQRVNFNTLASDKTGASWDNPAVLKAAQEVDQLVTGGYVIPGYTATKYPAQETNWANGKAAFYMDGDYVTSEVAKEVPASWKMASMLPPGAQVPDATLFGFSIPKRAKNVSAAERFIAFFMQKQEMSGMTTTALNITPRADIPAPPQLATSQQQLTSPTVRQPFDSLAGNWSPEVLDQNYLDMWHGRLTPAQFVAKCKAAQISYWKSQG
ncbi:ABC transporter substrate-binding protein [Streptomyces sp. LN785]|uniref:ABC transporter substrate-binding protein n=1 Tax=Streptomyces sp. LN785 TaxID=3112983 RepID=UPI0037166A56